MLSLIGLDRCERRVITPACYAGLWRFNPFGIGAGPKHLNLILMSLIPQHCDWISPGRLDAVVSTDQHRNNQGGEADDANNPKRRRDPICEGL